MVKKYIDAEKLIAEVERLCAEHTSKWEIDEVAIAFDKLEDFIISLQQEQPEEVCIFKPNMTVDEMKDSINGKQQEQPENMIQWTGKNLKEVIDFTGKSPRFEEWFKSWEEFETYVHQHNDILKLFCEDGSHFEVPVGAWIVKTPDGYFVPSIARFIHAKQEQPEVDLEEEIFKAEKKYGDIDEMGGYKILLFDDEFRDILRHFYKLGKNSK